MRKLFIAGNWKMNLCRREAVALSAALAKAYPRPRVDVAVCPPAVYLEAVVAAIGDAAILVGAQNCYHESKGAFTGEISPQMVSDVGCRVVIVGHSERRQYFHETDELVHRKTTAALDAGLTPIVCVGEQLADREAGRTMQVIGQQFDGALAELQREQIRRTVIAYEPVWAIGTGKVASPEQAEEVHMALREMLETTFGADIAQELRIQYGGSVNPDNVASLLAQPNIDGALVGGASLDAQKFSAIVDTAESLQTP